MPKKFSYETFGDPKAKDTIVFLHGWGGSRKSFYKLVRETLDQQKKKKLQLIVLDLPGFGNASSPAKAGWTTHDYGYWFEDFLKEQKLKSNIHLYGHSFGCRVIIRYLTRHQDFEGKVFLTGAAGIKWPPTTKTICTKFLSKILSPLKKIIPGFIQKKVLRRLGAGDWADAKPGLKNTFQKVLKEEDLRIHLAKIYQPVYLIWGKKDTYTPLKSAEVFHRALPHSRLKVFENGKHGIHYTHTEEISKIMLQFIK